MKTGIFYSRQANTKNYRRRQRFTGIILLGGMLLFGMSAMAQTITTFAGTAGGGYGGDGGPAINAKMSFVVDVAIDHAGNVYICDQANYIIRKVNTSGIITTVAGTPNSTGYSGDGGPATNAQLSSPGGIAVDAAGNLYIADGSNKVVRKVDNSGIITTFAGNNLLPPGYSGDGGPATAAQLYGPSYITTDAAGNVYFSEGVNAVVRMVNTSGTISTFAGTGGASGYSGDGFAATAAQISGPQGIAFDRSGNLYIGDENNNVIRVVNTSGIISTFAGDGSTGYFGDGGPATAAEFSDIQGLSTDASGNLYIADANNNVIRRINASGIVSTFAGNNTLGNGYSGDSGPATAAQLFGPFGVMASSNGSLYIADMVNNVVRLVANSSPVFVNGHTQSLGVCENSGSNDFSTDMVIGDADAGQTETWTVVTGPLNGSLAGFPATAASNGGAVSSTGMTYTPGGSFIGTDSFTVSIDDGNGGTDTAKMIVTVKPTPMMNSSLTPGNTCDSALFVYGPASDSANTTFTWTLAPVTNITAPAYSGADSIKEILGNTDTLVIPVVYTYVLTAANGCVSTANVTVNVVPKLLLTSKDTMPTVCNGVPFTYTANSSTPGVNYQWSLIPITGISNAGLTNTTNPLVDTLNDTTANPVLVTYSYSVIYGACSNTKNVVITVNPTPRLSSRITSPICDSMILSDTLRSKTAGTVFTWSRDTVPGIRNPFSSGTDSIINDTLVNTYSYPVSVVYVDSMNANGCPNKQNDTVVVNPKAMLTPGTITPPAICDNDTFRYNPTFTTGLGTTFAWTRLPATGITGGPTSGVDSIKELLHNSGTDPVVVTYVDTLTAYGCVNLQSVPVTVNPTPKLSSSHTPPALCDSAIFNYTPTSATTGASFSWIRPYVLGIDMLAGSGNDNPNEQLINTTYVNVNVVYIYSDSAHGCGYTHDTVTVLVHPTPTLSSPVTETICSGVAFVYVPTSHTPTAQVTYAWTRAAVTGITPATGSGATNINETLIDGTTASKTVVYNYILKVDGVCPHSENVTLTVNPAPTVPSITIHPPATLCSNTHYMNFGDTTTPGSGTSYKWTAVNGTVWAESANGQNSIISFNNSGNASVVLTTAIGTTACKSTDTFAVTVGTGVSDNPQVIFYNGQFMCLQNNVDNFQWGYDDATTLDSTLIPGEVNQVYFNSTPDLIHRYYWLMTTHNGCLQKTYYNAPTGISNINEIVAGINVYPNPASSAINVEVNAMIGGNMELEVMNLLGQKLTRMSMTDNKATVNVSELPSGCYLVNCYHDGMKIGTAKFIKN